MTLQKESQMTEIASLFRLKGHIVSCGEFGDGHINETFRVVCREGEKERVYILQRVNVNVFHDFVGLMENVQAVMAVVAGIGASMARTATEAPSSYIPGLPLGALGEPNGATSGS